MVSQTLSSLALSAESLLSAHQPSHGIPALQKTLEELEAESAALAGRGGPNRFAASSTSADDGARVAGAELLAGRNFDARALHRQIVELEARAAYAGGVAGDGEDLDHALAERTDAVVVSAIEGAIQDALEDSEAFALEEQVAAWDREKGRILEDLGLRALEWEPAQTPKPMELATAQRALPGPSPGAPKLDAAAAAHGEVVARLNRYALLDAPERLRVDDEGGMRVASDFGALATRPSALAVCWRVVHATCREDRALGDALAAELGVGARDCANACDAVRRAGAAARGGGAAGDDADGWLGLGARRALEAQFREYVDGKLRESAPALRAHVMGVRAYDAADDAARYAALLRAKHQLPRGTTRRGAATRRGEACFPQVYVALRCGGARAALAVVAGGCEGLDPAVEAALSARAALDAASELDGWRATAQAGAAEAAARFAEAAAALAATDGYRSSVVDRPAAGVTDDESCPFERSVLNLLALADPDLRDATVVRTVEDFCWHQLWFTASAVAARRGPGAARGYARRDLREAARAWGPDHFDADGETPFQYAIVLLVAGDYAGAVGHLGDRRLPQEALHLALALDAYGVLDVAAAPASKRPKLASPAGGAGGGGYDLGRACLAYARHVAVADPALALEYVFWLRHRDALVGGAPSLDDLDQGLAAFRDVGLVDGDAASSLLCGATGVLLETRAFDALCGAPLPDGGRGDGALDAHLARERVDALLALAARAAATRGHRADACRLHALRGDDVAVVGVLVHCLGACVASRKGSGGAPLDDGRAQDRAFWVGAARDFAARRLRAGDARVVDALRAAGDEALGRAFESLLNLAAFFDACAADAPHDALRVLDGLRLLPASDAELGPRLDDFYRAHSSVQKLLGDVLLRAMECVYVAHDRGKAERRDRKYRDAGASRGAGELDAPGDAANNDLKKRASLLVNFAALLKTRLGDDVHAQLGRYEAMLL